MHHVPKGLNFQIDSEMPSQERLCELFRYEDGKLIKKILVGSKHRAERAVGFSSGPGYLTVTVDGFKTSVHRCIWALLKGHICDGWRVEHINGTRDDNRVENLRCVQGE